MKIKHNSEIIGKSNSAWTCSQKQNKSSNFEKLRRNDQLSIKKYEEFINRIKWRRIENLLVNSIPVQKLPRHKKSAHLWCITFLEDASPLLFQVINFFFKKNAFWFLSQFKRQTPNAKLGYWKQSGPLKQEEEDGVGEGHRKRENLNRAKTEQNRTEEDALSLTNGFVCCLAFIQWCKVWFGLWVLCSKVRCGVVRDVEHKWRDLLTDQFLYYHNAHVVSVGCNVL